MSHKSSVLFGPLILFFLLWLVANPNVQARSVSKWEVFEEKFSSSRVYENPPQEARLTVRFVSPTGRTNRVHGFWDGGRRWGVRFSPDEVGRWTYVTECSDPANSGLDQQSGRFLCTVQSLRNRLQRHGRIQVLKGFYRFQQADGTPFLWTADGVWNGARLSTRKGWRMYVQVRSRQGFNVAMWRAAPGKDERGASAYTGSDRIELDPGFLRRLDEKVTALNNSAMVSAIAPLWEIGLRDDELLPEDQAIVLLRQMVGRWDAYQVAWMIAFDADTDGRRAARWRRIGRSVFDSVDHAPVILFCGASQWALKDFADESWVDAVAFQSGNDVSEGGSLWLARGPVNSLWMYDPARPILNLLPATEAGLATDGSRITTPQALEALVRSLFVAPPAGLCYESRAIADWDQSLDTNTVAVTGQAMTEWQKSLYLPGATRVGQIRELLERNDFDQLFPASSILLPSPASKGSSSPISALANLDRNRALVFVPDGETACLRPHSLRGEMKATFFSLKTGGTTIAAALEESGSTKYGAPGPGDWLLVLAPAGE